MNIEELLATYASPATVATKLLGGIDEKQDVVNHVATVARRTLEHSRGIENLTERTVARAIASHLILVLRELKCQKG